MAIRTITAINICVQVFLWSYIFISQENTKDKITRPYGSIYFTWESNTMFSRILWLCIPISLYVRIQVTPHLHQQLVSFIFLNFSHSATYAALSPCDFHLRVLIDKCYWTHFCTLIGYIYFLVQRVRSDHLYIFIVLCILLLTDSNCLCIWTQVLCQIYLLQIFPPRLSISCLSFS